VHDELAHVHEIAAQLASELGRDRDATHHRERAAVSRDEAEKARVKAARHQQPPG
jgi:hypothetical protein